MTDTLVHQIDTIEEINLDALTTEQLLVERDDVVVAISRIATSLQTQPGRPVTPEDESPAWRAYRDWRRRARLALDHKRRELVDIKACLRERKDAATASRQRRISENRATEHDLKALERGRQLREALSEQSDEALLLRVYRVIRHLLPGGEPLPSSLDAADRDALSMLSIRLRNAYGSGNLQAFVASPEGNAHDPV